MCGISGIIAAKENEIKKQLGSMNAILSHRGPDASGEFFCEGNNYTLGLAHRRLSIIDISKSADQPMRYKNFAIVYNGEVYNFKEIKQTLIDQGHQFLSNSDTEVVLHAYEQWGIECVKQFNGMFAFAIFDKDNSKLILARDRVGVKPLFYYYDQTTFLFASELKAFHETSFFKKEIDPNALSLYLKYGNIPAPYSIFKNTFKLEPGYTLEFDLVKSKISKQKYWSVATCYNKPKLNVSYSDAKQNIKELLQSAFEYRMIADVAVGVFLSGGYDSTCVTAMLQKDRTAKLKTFTVGTDIPEMNESEFAKSIAKKIGTDHQEFFCSQQQAKQLVKDLPYYYDEPFSDSSAIPTMFLSRNVKEHVKVVLSADGGDEIFAGYNRYDRAIRKEKLEKISPRSVLKAVSKLMGLIPHSVSDKNFYSYNESAWNKLKLLLADPSNKHLLDLLSSYFNGTEMDALLIKKNSIVNTAYEDVDIDPKKYSALSYFMAIDHQTYLPDDVMQKVDRATMSAGLEAREPFLDHRIIEFVAQLPDEFKYKNGGKKYILKDIVHDLIPEHMMKRPKMGFSIPIANWLSSDLKHLIEEYLDPKKIEAQGLFNADQITNLVNEFLSGKKGLGLKIWNLIVFQMWYQRWAK